jgi:hypothetical protein
MTENKIFTLCRMITCSVSQSRIFAVLAHWKKLTGEHVAPLQHIIPIPFFTFTRNTACLAEKQHIPILVFGLIPPCSNARSTTLEVSVLTITSPLRSVNIWSCVLNLHINWVHAMKCDPYRVWCSIFYSKLVNCILLRSLFVFEKGRGTCGSGERNVKIWIDFQKRLKLRFLTEIGRLHWNQGEEVAHFAWFGQPWRLSIFDLSMFLFYLRLFVFYLRLFMLYLYLQFSFFFFFFFFPVNKDFTK